MSHNGIDVLEPRRPAPAVVVGGGEGFAAPTVRAPSPVPQLWMDPGPSAMAAQATAGI